MSRKWTARKLSTLDEAAITAGTFAPAYTLHRADPDPADARRQVLRLLTAFTLLWLPVHCGICWLSTHSLGLATGAVLVIAGALFAVALAKWLALEDLLQKLPLLLVLVLIGLGLVFFTSSPPPRWGLGGADFFMGLFILMAVISILGGLYRPMAAAYQTVTLKTHFRDLCVGGAAMILSLGVVAVAHSLPKFGMEILACALAGGYAGLVLVEFAAWARANPDVGLERTMAFGKPPAKPGEPDDTPKDAITPRSAVLWAAVFGLSYGVLTVVFANARSPSPEFRRLALSLAEQDFDKVRDMLGSVLALGLMGMLGGFFITSTSLSGFRPTNPLPALPLAGRALVVFLTYPETSHPLVHRFRIPWLRPQSVRLALTGLVLVTAATATYAPVEKPRQEPAAEPKTPVYSPPFPSPPPAAPYIPPGDLELARITGQPPELWLGPQVAPPAAPPTAAETPKATAKPAEAETPGLLALVVGLVVGPPLVIYSMICLLGLTVLPTYFNYFEKPQPTGNAG
jgi:hypothetical protein